MLTVKCQNNRLRTLSDGNGSTVVKHNALCLRLLGRIADIDDKVLRDRIRATLVAKDPVEAIVKIFCDTFKVSYYCPGCKVFMDVQYTAPGYSASSIPRDEYGFDKVMRPRVAAKQMEIA